MTRLLAILDETSLGLRLHGSPAWLDREVAWPTTTELDDPTPWLSGGEVVLTTGLRLTTADLQRRWVERLASVDVGAIGFAVGLTHDEVPQAMLEVTLAARLPVLEVPYETPFVAITRWLADAVSSRHVEHLAGLLSAHEAMTEHLLTTGGLPGLLVELGERLDAPLAVVDEQGRVLAAQPQHEHWPVEEIRQRLPQLGPGPNVVDVLEGGRQQVVVQPIRIEGRTVGGLVCPRQIEQRSHATQLLAFAASLVGLEMRRRHAIRLGQQGQIGQVLQDLVRSAITPAEAQRRLNAVGVRPEGAHRVLLGTTDTPQQALRLLPSPLLGPDVDPGSEVVTAIVDRYVVVLCPSEEIAAEAAPVVLSALRRLGSGARVGIGGVYSGVEGVRWSFLEAREALARGPGIHQGDPLNLQRLLFTNPDLPVRELGEATLAPLLRADTEREGQELLTTLRTYLELDGSVAATAQRLFVHRNTVHHRIGRIESLTGRSLGRTTDRVQFWLALMAIDRAASDA